METLLSYHPRDLLLFSPRVYWTLVAGHNDAWWPLALLAPVAGLALVCLLIRRPAQSQRYALACMGAVWWFVSWTFLWQQYRDINWAVDWILAPFALAGGLLLLFAVSPGKLLRRAHRYRIGLALIAWASLGHPLGFLLDERRINAADTWLLFPDPLAVTTLGLALAWPPCRAGDWPWHCRYRCYGVWLAVSPCSGWVHPLAG